MALKDKLRIGGAGIPYKVYSREEVLRIISNIRPNRLRDKASCNKMMEGKQYEGQIFLYSRVLIDVRKHLPDKCRKYLSIFGKRVKVPNRKDWSRLFFEIDGAYYKISPRNFP